MIDGICGDVRTARHDFPGEDDIARAIQLGTNLYHKRYDPESLADMVLTVPFEV